MMPFIKRFFNVVAICLFILIASSNNGFCQNKIERLSIEQIDTEFANIKTTFDESPKEWVFSKVVNIEGHSSDEFYSAAKSVLSSLYSYSKEVIQSEDENAKTLVGKGYITTNVRTYSNFIISIYRIWQIVKIECRDNRYKITITTNDIQVQIGSVVDKNNFDNAAHKTPSDFYPYNESLKDSKNRAFSWDILKSVYDSANETIKNIDDGINKHLKNDASDW